MTGSPTLFIHAGPGKTGSTSIQNTCNESIKDLRSQGIAYLGMMLEHCEIDRKRDWQTPSAAAQLFQNTPSRQVEDEIYSVLSNALPRLEANGITKSIWCNESLFFRHMGVIDALRRLQADGIVVKVTICLRRHDSWAQSAYAQWGIRHKTYEGQVWPFERWLKERMPNFAPSLSAWEDGLADDIRLINYHAVDDAVLDFLDWVGASNVVPRADQITPGVTELVSWAVYNSRFDRMVMPIEYQKIANGLEISGQGVPPLDPPEDMLPSEDELRGIQQRFAEDVEALDESLAAHGQPTLSSVRPARANPVPTNWDIIRMLIVAVSSLQEQVDDLKSRLEER